VHFQNLTSLGEVGIAGVYSQVDELVAGGRELQQVQLVGQGQENVLYGLVQLQGRDGFQLGFHYFGVVSSGRFDIEVSNVGVRSQGHTGFGFYYCYGEQRRQLVHDVFNGLFGAGDNGHVGWKMRVVEIKTLKKGKSRGVPAHNIFGNAQVGISRMHGKETVPLAVVHGAQVVELVFEHHRYIGERPAGPGFGCQRIVHDA
jgi:hypothetical protein